METKFVLSGVSEAAKLQSKEGIASTALTQNTCLVESVQVLRDIGLDGVNFAKQTAHIFFTIAQAVKNFQT